jgi:hypothetical protein
MIFLIWFSLWNMEEPAVPTQYTLGLVLQLLQSNLTVRGAGNGEKYRSAEYIL